MLSVPVVLLLAASALGLLWWLVRRWRRGRADGPRADRIDTLIGWPPQATRVLSLTERQAFSVLARALPDCIVLAQVPISRFLKVPRRNSYADWLRRLGNQCVDFVVCDMHAQVLAVVELRAPAVLGADREQRRLTRLARSLKAAKVPLHVWDEGVLPTAEAAREAITPRPVDPPETASAGLAAAGAAAAAPVSVAVPVMAAATPAGRSAAAAANPFEDTGRDSLQDERIELMEPPPSTWFDDIDSESMPLRKPPGVKPAGPGRTRGR